MVLDMAPLAHKQYKPKSRLAKKAREVVGFCDFEFKPLSMWGEVWRGENFLRFTSF